MATSRQTYECFSCKKAGFPETRVFLDGRTEDGKTIYKNEDMSPHEHKRSANGTAAKLDIVNEKLDSIIELLSEIANNKWQRQQQQ